MKKNRNFKLAFALACSSVIFMNTSAYAISFEDLKTDIQNAAAGTGSANVTMDTDVSATGSIQVNGSNAVNLNQSGNITGSSTVFDVNSGSNLTINATGTDERKITGGSSALKNAGNLNITGGKLTVTGVENKGALSNSATTKVTGNVETSGTGSITNTGKIDVTGGTVSNSGSGSVNVTSVSNGTSDAVTNSGSGSVEVSGDVTGNVKNTSTGSITTGNVTGNVTNEGSGTSAKVTVKDVTSGSVTNTNSGSVKADSVSNTGNTAVSNSGSGRVEVSGSVSGNVSNTGSGSVQSSSIEGQVTNSNASGTSGAITTGTLTNSGTSTNAGTLTIGTSGAAAGTSALSGAGTVQNTGSMTVYGKVEDVKVEQKSGTLSVTGNMTSNLDVAGGQATVGGTAGAVKQTGGTLGVTGTASSVNISGGEATVGGVTGAITQTNGTLNVNGNINSASVTGGTINLSGNSQTLGSNLSVSNGATLGLTNDSNVVLNAGSISGTTSSLNLADGTSVKYIGNETINYAVTSTGTGKVIADSIILSIADGTEMGGNIDATSANVNFGAGSSFTGSTLKAVNSTVALTGVTDSSAIIAALSDGSSGNTLDLVGTDASGLSIGGSETSIQTVNTSNNGSTGVSLTGTTVNNGGKITNTGTLGLSGTTTNNGTIDNQSTLNIAGTMSGGSATTGSVTNSGAVDLSGNASGYKGSYTQSAGTTTVSGTMFGGASTINGGTLQYNTDAARSGSVTMSGGALVIGDSANSKVGTFTVGTSDSIIGASSIYIDAGSTLDVDKWESGLEAAVTGVSTGKIVADTINVTLTGDASGFGGVYSQTGKSTTVNNGATMFQNVEKSGGSLTFNSGSSVASGSNYKLNNTKLNLNDMTNAGSVLTAVAASGTNSKNNELTINGKTDSTTTLTQAITLGNNETYKNLTTTGKLELSGAITNSGTITNKDTGTLTLSNASITNNGTISNAGTLNLSGKIKNTANTGSISNSGTLNISGDESGYKRSYSQSTGTTNVTSTGTMFGGANTITDGTLKWNTSNALADGSTLAVNGGILKIGDETTGSIFTASSTSTIANAVGIELNAGSTLKITNTTISLGSMARATEQPDNWEGNLELNDASGTLNLYSPLTQGASATLNAIAGNLNVDGVALTIGKDSKIEEAVVASLINGSLTVTKTGSDAGSVTLDSADTWDVATTVSGGTLTLNGVTQGDNATINATGGTVDLQSGKLTIGTGSSVAAGSTMTMKVESGATAEVTGTGSMTMDSGDTWAGTILLNGATSPATAGLTLDGVTQTTGAILNATTGNLNVTGTTALTIGKDSQIAEAVVANLSGASLTITADGTDKGVVVIDSNDTWATDTTLNGGSLTLKGATQTSGKLTATTGDLTLNGQTITLDANHTIAEAVKTTIENSSNVTINSGSLTLDSATNDSWSANSTVKVSGGTLNYDGLTQNGTITAESGTVDVKSGKLTIGTGSSVAAGSTMTMKVESGATAEVTGTGSMTMDSGDTWAGTILLNGATSPATAGLTLDGVTQTTGAILNATTGNLNVTGTTALTIGKDSQIAEAVVANLSGASLTITANGTDKGNVVLGAGDTWNTDTTLMGGSLSITGLTQGTGKKLDAQSGDLTTSGATLVIDGNSQILDAVNASLTGGSLSITGGTVNLNKDATGDVGANDTWNIATSLTSGTLNLTGVTQGANSTLDATGGNLTTNGVALSIGTGSQILDAVNASLTDGSLEVTTGGKVELNTGDTWNTNTTLNGGSLKLTNVAQGTGKNFAATKGDLTLENQTFTMSGSNNTIADVVNVAITKDSIVNVGEGATLTLNTGDFWSDGLTDPVSTKSTINLDGGTLNYNDLTSNGKLNATSGTLNVESGILTVGNDGSAIASAVKTALNGTSKLVIDGATVYLDNPDTQTSSDSWAAGSTVQLKSGTLNYSLDSNGILDADAGNLNITGGTLTVGNSSSIENAVKTNIAEEGILKIIETANINLGSDDTWNGTIKLATGTLTINNLTQGANSRLQADSGLLNVLGSGSALQIANGSYIAKDVKATITGDVNIGVKGVVTLDDDTTPYDTKDSWTGTIYLNGQPDPTVTSLEDAGVLNYAMKDPNSAGKLKANTGRLNLLEGSYMKLGAGSNSEIAEAVALDIQSGSTLEIENGNVTLDSATGDKWNGTVKLPAVAPGAASLTTKGLTNSTADGGGLQQEGGTLNIEADDNGVSSHISITDANSYITGGYVNITGESSLQMGGGTKPLHIDKLTMADDSYLSIMNGFIENGANSALIDNLVVTDDSKANFAIDIQPREHLSDVIKLTDATVPNGAINISDFDFVWMPPIDRYIELQVFDVSGMDPDLADSLTFEATDKQIFTPIGYYELLSKGSGRYQAHLAAYNPQVFRGKVATLAAYNNQLLVSDTLTNHFILNGERLVDNAKMANKYAAGGAIFEPYQKTYEEGGLWTKNYMSFEKLSMTHNINVHNNAYGTIFGADLPAIELKKGWKYIPTPFVSYNGGHQHFNSISNYQNGAQIGLMNTFIKDNFIGSVVGYGGGYLNEMSIPGGIKDETANWFAGTAAKAAYNYKVSKHFTLQPTAFVSYNAFGEQNWMSSYGVMSMHTGMLNGINAAPGLNMIYGRDTWSLYSTVSYMYNINDKIDGSAGRVDLPDIRMRHGYIQYGFGGTKTFKDRFNAYGQMTFRNAGRTGIGFQAGLQYMFDMNLPWMNSGVSKKTESSKKLVSSKKTATAEKANTTQKADTDSTKKVESSKKTKKSGTNKFLNFFKFKKSK